MITSGLMSDRTADSTDSEPNWSELDAPAAVELLVDRFGGPLYGLALRLCGTPEDAEDLAQEVFLQAFRKWDQFEGRSQPSTWLHTIATRACARRHRRRSGEPSHIDSLDQLWPDGTGPVPEVPDRGGGPLADALDRETRERVEGALAALPDLYRMPLILKDVMGLDLAAVGEILGIKPQTVKTRLHRARLQLRQVIEQALPRHPAPPEVDSTVCRDLLMARMEAADRGVPFPVPCETLTERCAGLIQTLEASWDVCRQISREELPPEVRERLLARVEKAA